MGMAEKNKYQFEADESDEQKEIHNNLNQLSGVTVRLKGLAMATGQEVDWQNKQIDKIIQKIDFVVSYFARRFSSLLSASSGQPSPACSRRAHLYCLQHTPDEPISTVSSILPENPSLSCPVCTRPAPEHRLQHTPRESISIVSSMHPASSRAPSPASPNRPSPSAPPRAPERSLQVHLRVHLSIISSQPRSTVCTYIDTE